MDLPPPDSLRGAAGRYRARLEDLLSPWLAPECAPRLWSETWGLARVSPSSLSTWVELHGPELAALAVAARLDEVDLRRHLDDGLVPDRAALEMLADLNCFPHATPAARPLAVA
jgi:hypothetical protein